MKVCIIGIGRFGYALASQLNELNIEVLAIDQDRDAIHHVKNHVTHAVATEIVDEDSLRAIGVDEMNTVIVAIGNNFAHSVLITRVLKKKLLVPRVIVRANDTVQKEVLELVGADKVILPEEDAAHILADTLSSPFPFIVRLDEHYAITSMPTPPIYFNVAFESIDFFAEHHLHCFAYQRAGKLHSTEEKTVLHEGDRLFVAGRLSDLRVLLKFKL
jgi:trk system potassium uptake protein TrkA